MAAEVFRQRASYRRALRRSLSDEAVRHGPDWLVAQALADGTLQQVLAPSAQVRFAIHAVWP
ncbi:hypothetical protein CQA70_22830, partial [Klebsiella pneumoniae]